MIVELTKVKAFLKSNLLISKSTFLYFFFKFLYSLLKSFQLKMFLSPKFYERAINKYKRLEFERLFFQLKLKEAYKSRIEHSIFCISNGAQYKAQYSNYLCSINDANFFEWLVLSEKSQAFLAEFTFKKLSYRIDALQLDKNASVFIGGPKVNFDTQDFSSYNYLIFNKPPPEDVIRDFTEKKVIIFCGPTWLKTKRSLVSYLKKRNKNLIFFSEADDPLAESYEPYNAYPKFPFGACLMNLQRTLIAASHLFSESEFTVSGYDFSIHKNHHNSWYQKRALLTGSNILWTLGRHDFLLSLLFTKNFFKNNSNFNGDTVNLLEEEFDVLMNIFISTYSSSRVRA